MNIFNTLPFRILRRIYVWLRAYFALVGFCVTVLPILLWYVIGHKLAHQLPIAQLSEPVKKHSGPVMLVLNLDGAIAEKQESQRSAIIQQLFGTPPGIYLPEVRARLRQAAEDQDVKSLFLQFGSLASSFSSLEELRHILEDFKASQKPITAITSNIDNASIYLASIANEIILAPAGSVMIPGPAISQVYFGDGIRKLGVDIQVLKAGKYKNAFETFVKNDPSPESQEEYRALEESLRNQLVKKVSEGRKKPETEVRGWFKKSVFTPEEAVKVGIADSLAYSSIPTHLIEEDEGVNGYLDLSNYESSEKEDKKSKHKSKEAGLALIEAVGEIHMDSGDSSDQVITPESIIPELKWAAAEEKVKAVVLRISSPGGSATASDIIWDEIRQLADAKPTVVSMGSYAASGGYYMAVGAKKIVADPTTITGSIGVISMLPNFSAFKEKYGVTFHTFTGSDRQGLLNQGKKLSNEDRALLENSIADVYKTFKSRVSKGRGLTMEQVEVLAQGRVYTGEQAQKLGLVDTLGGLKDAFQIAKVDGGLDPNELYPIHHYEPKTFTLSQCFSSLSNARKCLKKGAISLKLSVKNTLLSESERNLLNGIFEEVKHVVTMEREPMQAFESVKVQL